MALLTVSYNNPWQLKLKSISLLKCFAVHPLQQCFVRVRLCSSWGCWHVTNFCKEAFFFFFFRFFYNQNAWKATWTLQTKVREIVDRIMASLNEAIEKEGLKKKKRERARDEDEEPLFNCQLPTLHWSVARCDLSRARYVISFFS